VEPSPPVEAGGTSSQVARGRSPDLRRINEQLHACKDDKVRDRLQAQKLLAGRFQIVDDSVQEKDRLPNQVTQAQFEETAALFSDIRTGNSDLEFDTATMKNSNMTDKEVEVFKAGALTDMIAILQTESGRDLLRSLAYQQDDHKTRLRLSHAPRANSTDALVPFPQGAAEDGEDDANGSNGTGTNASVRYVPGKRGTVTEPGGSTDPWLPQRSDVVLFHELTHAMHDVQGTTATGIVQAGPDVPADDVGVVRQYEHQAVGIGAHRKNKLTENRYRAERALLGKAGAVGGLDDDATMPQRDNYRHHLADGAPVPVPAVPLTSNIFAR
jgi:hypothetical protein